MEEPYSSVYGHYCDSSSKGRVTKGLVADCPLHDSGGGASFVLFTMSLCLCICELQICIATASTGYSIDHLSQGPMRPLNLSPLQ